MTENGDGPVLLDRLSDRFFKYLFAREEHKDLLIAFLNEVLLDLNPDGSARRFADALEVICENSKCAVFVLENWQAKGKSPALQSQVGRRNDNECFRSDSRYAY